MTPTAKSRFLYGVKSPTNLRGAVFFRYRDHELQRR